jgi:hypothetical protein
MTMTGALYLDGLDLVHAPVFVLDIDQSVLLRANESLRRILPKGHPEPPAPFADFIGAGPRDSITAFIKGMAADGSRNTLSVTCPTANGTVNLILHLERRRRGGAATLGNHDR